MLSPHESAATSKPNLLEFGSSPANRRQWSNERPSKMPSRFLWNGSCTFWNETGGVLLIRLWMSLCSPSSCDGSSDDCGNRSSVEERSPFPQFHLTRYRLLIRVIHSRNVCGTWDLPHSLRAVCEKRITRGRLSVKFGEESSSAQDAKNLHPLQLRLLEVRL
jgi:hypothetical protein